MKRKILYVLYALLAIFIIIQFFHPKKNLSDNNAYDIGRSYSISPEVTTLLHNACCNCHSNKSEYPWYNNIQPVAWWMANHIKEGKQKLNFSEFTKRKIAVQNHKFEEIVEMIEEKEMPLVSYTWLGLHPEAKLTGEERKMLIDWAKEQMASISNSYPPDSLVLRRPKSE